MESINEKLVRVTTRALPNEQHFRFHTENDGLYTKYGVSALGIEPFILPFRSKLSDLDAALERIQKSAETERIALADQEFDRSFSGMHGYTHSCMNHFNSEVRRAAENMMIVFDHYGNIGKEAYRQELGSSFNLLQDLRARPDDLAALALEPWIAAHEQAANALAALLDARNVETSKQTDLIVRQTRRELDAIYQQITDRIDAMINLYGKDFVPGFVAEYNAHATEYKNKLAQHLGRIHAGKKNNNDEA
ncbi:MAG: DUF6261 family protein [Bacteroidales bacterium]|jgi:hypothetical protein|nr:DUF6261 family protein [Bacteroidales bacterium]